MRTIAFVIPWYGSDIRGGAESECNQLAHCLQSEGLDVEIFTTCVKEAAADRGVNTLPSGAKIEDGVLVRRFLVDSRDVEKFNKANYKLYHNLPVTEEEERWYANNDINSSAMYKYIYEHKDKYHCFIFMPYLYGITYNGLPICKDKAIMLPCLHNESYAYMRLTKNSLETVKGIIFLSKPEAKLAKSIANLCTVPNCVLGAYVESGWEDSCNAMAFRDKYNIYDDFILYAGRKDSGKKADELLTNFIKYKNNYKDSKVKLVFIGGGSLEIPDNYKSEIVDLGFVSVDDKHNAMAAATLLCNPSWFESFSIVIMESWLARRPVLVSEHCEVTTNFCLESNGGLYYSNYLEFEACLNYILLHEEIANIMGNNGYNYVRENFTYDVIGKKYIEFIKKLDL